jgi:hypothetical protein
VSAAPIMHEMTSTFGRFRGLVTICGTFFCVCLATASLGAPDPSGVGVVSPSAHERNL